MKYEQVLGRLFSTFSTEGDFVAETHRALAGLGFTADNSLAIVAVCRDEISQTIMHIIRDQWGEAFNLCSLAGMFFAGRTALQAAMHHAPKPDGRERHLFFTLAHVAVDGEGHVGMCRRPGCGPSHACGALSTFRAELESGRVDVTLDEHDLEQSLLKERLVKEIRWGDVPDLLALTRLTQRVALADLEHALEPLLDPSECDHAVLSGIQIHGPDANYVAPTACYAVVRGERMPLPGWPAG